MNHGSLFSGFGGFDLASDKMGWGNCFHCEISPFPRRVLQYYWPNAKSYEDITKTDFTFWRGRIDVLTGGFPCQPYSVSGKRLGKEDDRHLWPEMLRAIREIQPTWVVGENVRGIINWSSGLVFEEVQTDLEAEGYEVQSFVLPAAGVGAPHERYRVWFIAYSNNADDRRKATKSERSSFKARLSKRNQIQQFTESNQIFRDFANANGIGKGKLQFKSQTSRPQKGNDLFRIKHRISAKNAPHAKSNRLEGGWVGGIPIQKTFPKPKRFRTTSTIADSSSFRRVENNGFGKPRQFNPKSQARNWENFPTQSPLCSGNDGLPSRLDGITFSKWRNASLEGFGNAVVPDLVIQIFKAIEEYSINNK